MALVQTTRPRQWPKNLLVFAAPLAGHTMGRPNGFWYALTAAIAFVAASSAVYLINDVVDVERDRNHPYKKNRPIASGRLPARHAVVAAVFLVLAALGAGLAIGEPLLTATIAAYLTISFLYSAGLKHTPFIEIGSVASGFRAARHRRRGRHPRAAVGLVPARVQPRCADGDDRQALHRADRARGRRGEAPPGDARLLRARRCGSRSGSFRR